MPIKIVSFGHEYKPVVTTKNDIVIDVRKILHHPYSKLRTGLSDDIQEIIMNKPDFEEFYMWALEQAEKTSGIVYIGCHSGQHRSVFIAQKLSEDLEVPILHRDIIKNVLKYRHK
jgi:RNase adaptor protein for sRNA GlmZ degradation